jgi:hypothetical protein
MKMFTRKINQVLSLALVALLLLGIFPVTVFAAENEAAFSMDEYVSEHPEELYGTQGDIFSDSQSVDMTVAVPITLPEPTLRTARAMVSQSTSTTRYTVLVLDTSGSMAGTPLTRTKQAAVKFCEQIMVADGDNYVAVVSFNTSASTVCNFSDDLTALTGAINRLVSTGSTSQYAALVLADTLLENAVVPGAIKNIVVMSDGLPETGVYSDSGPYTSSDYGYYRYANAAYTKAQELKSKYYIYSLGFFHSLSGNTLTFGRRFMSDLQNAGYYDVVNPDDIDFVFGEIAKDITKKSGIFSYPGDGRDYSATYYYDDDYFTESSYTYNEHLATMSLCLELSAWGSEDVGNSYTNKSNNAYNLLTDIGFTDFEANAWFKVKPTKDSIGAVAAQKTINENGKEYTLIALAIRGGGYESEWASNFTLGVNGQHQGFSEARDQVIAFLQDYIRDKGISGDMKLWITGYSRAAATANMVAGAIDEGSVSLPGCSLALPHLYAYTFETPVGALKSTTGGSVFNNIFNIINPNDPVPKVAPATWSFARYGLNRELPSRETSPNYADELKAMLIKWNALDSTPNYDVENFTMKKIKIDWGKFLPGGDPFVSIVDDIPNAQSQNAFLNSYITMLAKDFLKSRATFVNRYQSGIRDVCGLFFGASKSQTDKLIEVATDKFSNNWGWIAYEFLKPNPYLIWNSSANEQDAYKKVAQYLRESLDAAGITQYTSSEFDHTVETLMDLVVAVLANHPNLATTMVQNISGIGQAHVPELCLAWMQSMDAYYTPGGAVGFTSGKYRIVRINCPVDVNVYNGEQQLVASILNDVPQNVSSIVSAINEDGEKLVFLPATADYTVELTATAEGIMSYAVNEYSPEAGETNRLVNYYDIPIVALQTFIGLVPAYSDADLAFSLQEGSSVTYALSTNGGLVAVDSDISGDEATSAYFMVNAAAKDNAYGIVTGQGLRQLGSFAQLEAIPYDNCKFDGWYEDGELLSTDETYRFRVDADISLTAVFSPPEETQSPSKPSTDNNDGNDYTSSSTSGGASKPATTATVPAVTSEPETEATGAEDTLTTIDTVPNDVPLSQAPVQREITKSDLTYIYGQNRVLTAIAISQQGWNSADTIVLAPGGNDHLIDALAVAPLAYQENAPILISVDDDIDTAILAEIQRLGATKIIAVGALSDSLIEQLQTIFPNIEIEVLRGADRFTTATLINAKINNIQGTVVIGYDAIADAVSIASWAAANRYAIHIANPDGSANPPQYGSGTNNATGGTTNYILGGPTLVQDLPGYTRIYGLDRYATNLALRQALNFNNDTIYTADGNTLVDALTGSVLAAKTRSAIVLTPNNDPTGADFGNITADTKVYALGGAK